MNDEKPDGLEALEEAREKGLRRMDGVGTWFEDLGVDSSKKYKGLKQSFEQARVQLALGQMEAGDAFEERKKAFESAATSARSKLNHLESTLDDDGRFLWDKVLNSWEEIENRLETAYIGVMFSEVLWEHKLKNQKEKFHGAVVDLQSDLKEHVGDGSRLLDRFLTKSEGILGKGSEKAHKVLHRFFDPK